MSQKLGIRFRAAEIARRMGVEVNIDHLEKEIEQCDSETARKYFQVGEPNFKIAIKKSQFRKRKSIMR